MRPLQALIQPDHVPFFVPAPGQTDVLLAVVALVLIGAVMAAGVLFFWLHSLPERMVHNRAQFDVVAVLALLSLFTHIHAFWVAALLLALIRFPSFSVADFSGPLDRIANSLENAVESRETKDVTPEPPSPKPLPTPYAKTSPPSAGKKQKVQRA